MSPSTSSTSSVNSSHPKLAVDGRCPVCVYRDCPCLNNCPYRRLFSQFPDSNDQLNKQLYCNSKALLGGSHDNVALVLVSGRTIRDKLLILKYLSLVFRLIGDGLTTSQVHRVVEPTIFVPEDTTAPQYLRSILGPIVECIVKERMENELKVKQELELVCAEIDHLVEE